MSHQTEILNARLRTRRLSADRRYTGSPVVVLANRAPFQHERNRDGEIEVKRSASGLVTAVEPLLKAHSGVWIAQAAGDADALCVDGRDGLDVPALTPRYRLRYVWLTDEERRGYYDGFANEGLWPLCHNVRVPPQFRVDDFRSYRVVNRRFVAAACDETTAEAPLVFIQDYHFALAPLMVRNRLPLSTVVTFWHIPWPQPHAFAICPFSCELLEGMLGADIIGFQTDEDCSNFMDSVESTLDCDIDRERQVVTYRGRSTLVRAYPVGIEWGNDCVRTAPPIADCRRRVCDELGIGADIRLGIGIDRLDYTKGIDLKFQAIERLFETRPELVGRFTFVQVAEPSRDCLSAYRAARLQLLETSRRVNNRFGHSTYRPIVLLDRHHEPEEVYRFYRAADLCYVGSLHDGMNLVAKEFVCARDDEQGVLVLSRFAGASQQLAAAVRINPYVVDEAAQALAGALSMTEAEQSARMRRLRTVVERFDSRWWAGKILHDASLMNASPRYALARGERAERLPA